MAYGSAGTEDSTQITPDTVGTQVDSIPVELSTRFLEHFSEQLYSSPQKAFEELISNGWDAGASIVDVRVSPDLHAADATLSVFDNGASMDLNGLRELWQIAFSPKEGVTTGHGRPLIGKFGIGKLATYVLAGRLTYICKAKDGIIRRVTMNYGDVNKQEGAETDRLINDMQLKVFELDAPDLAIALNAVYGGEEILQLIDLHTQNGQGEGSSKKAEQAANQYEFGGTPAILERPEGETWTLAVLSDLKPAGRALKLGILRRMLAAALPFGSEMAIFVNEDRLMSPKTNAALVEEWVIGPDLDISHIELEDADIDLEADNKKQSDDDINGDGSESSARIEVKSDMSPHPYIELPGLGRITGRLRLFEEKITGGKSEERGTSNGFHVNVLGRIINQHDTSFGEKNLNHAAWARFRMTVRVDGLNKFLTTNREQFKECREIKIFRAFLRKAFNKARKTYDSDGNAVMPDGGDVLVQSLGVVSLNPLRSVVSEALRSRPQIPDLFDDAGIDDREARRTSWREDTAENIKNALDQVKYEKLEDESFVKFRIDDSTIVVNREHPFVIEHSHSKAEKELIRTVAMIDLLSDVYALDIGIDPGQLHNVRHYRDRLMRFRALQRRQSGVYIARLLQHTQHDSKNPKRFEKVVNNALSHLDFDLKVLGQSGEPEGIARAFTMPADRLPTKENPHPPSYSFSYDAKSSKHDVAQTGNISLDAVVQHRERYNADYALVIAPGYSEGALKIRCEQQRVTPMTASDLGKLLKYTVDYGAIPVTTFREVFEYFDPEEVSNWVKGLESRMKASRKLTIDVFIKALEELKGKVPDALAASTVAFTCRESLDSVEVKETDVIALAKGLQVIVPDLVGVEEDKIVVNASASNVAEAIRVQMEDLHSDDDN